MTSGYSPVSSFSSYLAGLKILRFLNCLMPMAYYLPFKTVIEFCLSSKIVITLISSNLFRDNLGF